VNLRTKYDQIGTSYTASRTTDPRIAAPIHAALGDATSVLNVGAGSGSYEPHDRFVVAVEPSATMISHRPAGAAPAVRGVAEALPFPVDTFDAAMGVLTMHHWNDIPAGLTELRRVSRRQVLFFFEPVFANEAWIVYDYFPEMMELETERNAPGTADIARHLDVVRVDPVPVPANCTDGFAGCYWNRPEAYLDPVVQEGMSCFAQMPADVRDRGMERLAAEIASGEWDRKYGNLRALPECDLGYRVLLAQ
jgi:SAM-dependent methyltransferase